MSTFKVKVTLTRTFELDTSDYESEDDDGNEIEATEEEAIEQFAEQLSDGDIELDDGTALVDVEKVKED